MPLLAVTNIHKTFEKETINENLFSGLWISKSNRRLYFRNWWEWSRKSALMNSIAGAVEIDRYLAWYSVLSEGTVADRSRKVLNRVFKTPRIGQPLDD